MSQHRIARLLAGGMTTLAMTATAVVGLQTAAHATAQCSDGIDNDKDGNVDYPADPGCSSATDNSESVTCTSGVCAGISASTELQRVRVYNVNEVPGTVHTVAGYEDLYRFTLPNGTVVNLPCVVLVVDSATTNPCADNNGVFVVRQNVLVNQPVAEPVVQQGDQVATAAICAGELVLTVDDIGIASARAYTVC